MSELLGTEEEPRREWRHRKGDEFVVSCPSVVGDADRGFFIAHSVDQRRFPSVAGAIAHGFTEFDRSDDFNVLAIRNGKVAAVLWMNEIVDDDPSVLAQFVGLV